MPNPERSPYDTHNIGTREPNEKIALKSTQTTVEREKICKKEITNGEKKKKVCENLGYKKERDFVWTGRSIRATDKHGAVMCASTTHTRNY